MIEIKSSTYIEFQGEVIHGKQLGRTIGFPTANIHLSQENGILDGTYKLNGIIDGKIFHGVGTYRKKLELFEAHFFDFDQDIYGEEIAIILLSFLRNNKNFSSLQEVKRQIKKDIESVVKREVTALTFGTFDIFHPGHRHYLLEAKKYADTLVTIVGTDKNVEKLKGKKPKNTQDIRMDALKKQNIADYVFIGEESGHLEWLQQFSPCVVCIGYDQTGFVHELEEYHKKNKIDIELIRIEGYRPDIYKSSKILK